MEFVRRASSVLCSLLVSVLAALGLVLGASPAAHAEESDQWQVVRHDTHAVFQKDGTAKVTTTLDYDFGQDPSHGPFLNFVTRMGIKDDPDHWRRIDVDRIRVSSPSGANTDVKQSTSNGVLTIRVGREGRTYRGTQRYVVSYRLHGVVDPRNSISTLDEVNWNVIGTAFTLPIRNASTTLELPGPVEKQACWVDGRTECSATRSASGTSVTYQYRNLQPGERMQVVAGLAPGTFVGAEPKLSSRANPAKAFSLSGANLGLGAAVLAAGSALVALVGRRQGRDEVYVGLTPGLSPADGLAGATERRGRKAPVAVQFSPPEARPGEAGTLIDERADHRDVTATIIDLAVRGHLQVEQTGRKEWTFTRTSAPTDELLDYEKRLLNRLFRSKNQVTTHQLERKSYADLFPSAKRDLYRQVVQGRHWFNHSPETTRAGWLGAGVCIVVLGVVLTILGVMALNMALPGIAVALVGLLLAIVSPHMPARTPEGSAALAQLRGFELYLRTAEAEQLKFEEGEDIFSKYLPWAIMLGVAERWSKLFEELAAQGLYDTTPTWYVGNNYGFGYGYIGGSMSSMGDTVTSAMSSSQAAASAASSASSGGSSGFSVGGGGGGFGGGGGGAW